MNTNITNLQEFLQHIISNTNMTCLTPLDDGKVSSLSLLFLSLLSNLYQNMTSSASNFLAANLYATSVFGEDALVNVSVERKDDGTAEGHGTLSGYIRIRSKTQGIALSLGDRITSIQRFQPKISKTEQP